MGGSSPPAPDPGIAKAAQEQADTGQQALDFMKQQAAQETALQQQYNQQWTDTVQPMMTQYDNTAMNYASADNQAKVAATAGAAVQSGAAAAQGTLARNEAALGINPASGAAVAAGTNATMNAGIAQAGAENNARTATQQEGLTLMQNGIAQGNTLIDAGQSALSGATNAGEGGFSAAQTGLAGQVNSLNTSYQEQLSNYNAQQAQTNGLMGGLGAIVGAIPSSGWTALAAAI